MRKSFKRAAAFLLAALAVLSLHTPQALAATYTGTVNKDKVFLRAQASTSSIFHDQLDKGTKVTLTGIKGDFYKVEYKKVTGYIMCSLVTAPIARVTANGIVTADGVEHPTDVLVVATGFHVTDSPFFERVRGTDGRTLADKWASEGMEAYKGTTVSGYPNLFVLVGPATGLGHSSMIYMIESQLNYLVSAMQTMRDRNLQTVDVREVVQEAYNGELRASTSETVWTTGCKSWYLDDKGNAPAVWPDFTFAFRKETREFDLSAYRRTAAAVPAGASAQNSRQEVRG